MSAPATAASAVPTGTADAPGLPDECTHEELAGWLDASEVHLTATPQGRLRYDAPADVAGPRMEAALRRHRAALLASVERPPDPERARVSEEQRGLVSNHERSPEPAAWNIPLRLRLRGDLHQRALRTALHVLVRRHAALRCRFVRAPQDGPGPTEGHADGGGLWQEVLPAGRLPLDETDLRDTPAEVRDRRADELCAAAADTPFDLAVSTVPRVLLLRTGDRDWTLLVVLHHICCDGWSLSLLVDELAALYRRARGDTGTPPLPAPTLQCTDYAEHQRERRVGPEERGRRLRYWADQLGGCPTDSGLPTDRPRPARLSGAGNTARTTLAPDLMAGVATYARHHGTTPFAVTVAALAAELTGRTGRPDVMLSTSYANRPHRELEGLMALTARTILLRLTVRPETPFPEICHQVTGVLLGGVDHLLPLVELRDGLHREHGIDLPPFSALSMTYQSSLHLAPDLPGLRVDVVDQETTTTRRDCAFGLIPLPDGSGQVYAEFSTDLFDGATVDGWLGAYAERLRRLVSDVPALPALPTVPAVAPD